MPQEGSRHSRELLGSASAAPCSSCCWSSLVLEASPICVCPASIVHALPVLPKISLTLGLLPWGWPGSFCFCSALPCCSGWDSHLLRASTPHGSVIPLPACRTLHLPALKKKNASCLNQPRWQPVLLRICSHEFTRLLPGLCGF